MTSISMTTFIDFVSATSTAKITCVKNAKSFYEDNAPYERRAFYLGLKTAVAKCFEADGDKIALDQCVDSTHDAKKRKSYEKPSDIHGLGLRRAG